MKGNKVNLVPTRSASGGGRESQTEQCQTPSRSRTRQYQLQGHHDGCIYGELGCSRFRQTIGDLVNRFAFLNGDGTPVSEKTATGDD